MNFLYPLAFMGLISIPAIIAMYLLKQNYREIKSASNILWERAVSRTLSQKPWQKLKKELLMLLQILAVLLLVFALAGPFIKSKGESQNYILVLDASLSMQAKDISPSRFESAKKALEKTLEELSPNGEFALVLAQKEPYVAVNFTDNKKDILNKLNTIDITGSTVDEEELIHILEALYNNKEAQILVFSDYGFDLKGLSASNFPIGSSGDNAAITLMSHSVDSDRIVSLVKVKNYGSKTIKNSIALYGDTRLIDIKDFQAEPGEEVSIFFTDVPLEERRLMAKLSEEDILEADNVYYDVIEERDAEKTIVFSQKNIFLENVIGLIPSVELYKGDISNMEDISGYHLYIFDGVLPEKMPEDGHVLIFNPPAENGFIEVSGEEEIDKVFKNNNELLNFIEDIDFDISKSKIIKEPDWANTLISSDKGPLVMAGERQGSKTVIFSFDLHHSDFPLKKEFPIFMYNLMGWFVPEKISKEEKLYTDSSIEFNIYPGSESVKIVSPDKKTYTLAPPFPAGKFLDGKVPGIYTMEQIVDGKSIYSDFAINLSPEGDESNLLKETAYDSSLNEGLREAFKSIELKNPFIIIALIVILAEWYVLNGFKIKRPDIIRGFLIFLIIVSLLDINIKRSAEKTTTIFALDMSSSVSLNMEETIDKINKAFNKKDAKDIVGSVAFGERAVINSYPSEEVSYFDFNSYVNSSHTNISDGLTLGSTIIDEKTKKRIVLISDGNENIGDAQKSARSLSALSIPVDVYYTASDITDEAQITSVNVPKAINKNSGYQIDVNIYSLSENSGNLLIYRNDKLIVKEEIELKEGENRLVFSDVMEDGGNIIYRAELAPLKDAIYENNTSYAYSYVEDMARVLILSKDGSGDEITSIIENSRVYYDVYDSMEIPEDIESLNMYDSIVLADISLEDMPEGADGVLEAYVKSGGGLVVTGGENSFALGGYYGTKIEEALPVSMELEDEGKLPNQGMILVLDRSGSMSGGAYGISKLELAKEAAIRSVDALSEKDYFGVIAFDTQNIWVSDYNILGSKKEDVKNKIANISPGGGTSILPAVTEAYNVLKNSDTKLKHIILLTDGQDDGRGYNEIINKMKAEGITLSAVSVGQDSDKVLLKRLAEDSGGRYYYSDEFTDLPKIFTKETFMAGKKYINDEEFYPIIGSGGSILQGISELPSIGGFINSTGKPRADVILYAKDKAPLLASWQYGLGRSIAYLSDYNGHWSSKLINTDEGVRLFRNMMSYALRKQVGSDITVAVEPMGDKSRILVGLPYLSEEKTIEAKIISPDMTQTDAQLKIVSPGKYEGEIPVSDTGAYIMNLETLVNQEEGVIVTGFNIPYSPEYDIRNIAQGKAKLMKIAELTGGRFIENMDDVFEPLPQRVYESYNIGGIILILAIILLLMDIASRRFPFIKRKFIKNKETINKIGKTAELDNDVSILLDGANRKEGKNKNVEKAAEINNLQKNKTADLLLKSKQKRSGR